MNPSSDPINQYSLQSLELWLENLGSTKDKDDPSKWHMLHSNWKATIIFGKEDFIVTWDYKGELTKRLFSYSINKEDVENAILQGP